jgi:hypothetical protein
MIKNIKQIKKPFYFFPKRTLYYDNLNVIRNVDFVLNLGMNNIPNSVGANINFFKLLKFFSKRKFINNVKEYYKKLLFGIVNNDLKTFEAILEPNLRYVLYKDLAKFSKYKIKIKNENEPIFVKILNIYELQNVNLDRELNGHLKDYEIKYKGKNKLVLSKIDPNANVDRRALEEIEKERDIFEKSDFKTLALNHLKDSALLEFNLNFAKNKLGNNSNEKNLEYISSLIENLQKSEKEESIYTHELKKEFGDYYSERDKFVDSKLKQTDLYEYFRNNFPSNYNKLFTVAKSKQLGMYRMLMTNMRKYLLEINREKSKKVSSYKTLYIIDVEIITKMHLEITDKNDKNILDSVYNYSNIMKNNNNVISNNNEYLDYDTSIYKFKLPSSKWNLDDQNYMQSHLLRFEFEKKNIFQNVLKNVYKSMMITDIDLALKGNKHFSFDTKEMLI